MRLAPWVLLISTCPCACSRTTPTPVAIVADDAGPIVDAAKPLPTTTATTTAKITPSYCDADADCAWDPPCGAVACVARKSQKPSAEVCDGPVPGPCVCADGVCAARRHEAPTRACKSDADCGFDAPTGRCGDGPPMPIREQGGLCRCDAGKCAAEWVGPVACKTTKDCSWLEDPLRPAPASKVPRPYATVKPCATGSRDSVCVKGVCRIVVWKC
ncbi:MAG: hypothetical protein HYV09_28920 [Deltaproteobacteria bacterium]|nr:hypothetical protein [Deltaproteobacteria bacterium]